MHERISIKILWSISQNVLHTCHSSSILLCMSSKNMWRICEEYVTVYCLKFYIILSKFKSVWIYRKLWRILKNRVTLNATEIWNLNRFKETYKHEKIKNQKQRKKDFFMSTIVEKEQDRFTRLLLWNAKRIFISTNSTGKNITWKPVSNNQYSFLNTLCNSWIFYTDTFPILW